MLTDQSELMNKILCYDWPKSIKKQCDSRTIYRLITLLNYGTATLVLDHHKSAQLSR